MLILVIIIVNIDFLSSFTYKIIKNNLPTQNSKSILSVTPLLRDHYYEELYCSKIRDLKKSYSAISLSNLCFDEYEEFGFLHELQSKINKKSGKRVIISGNLENIILKGNKTFLRLSEELISERGIYEFKYELEIPSEKMNELNKYHGLLTLVTNISSLKASDKNYFDSINYYAIAKGEFIELVKF